MQHYFNHNYLACSSRHHCVAYSPNQFLLTNSNHIQLYQANPISYQQTYSFMCKIGVIEVLPSKHQQPYIFIGDVRGRFGIYHLKEGMVYSHDKISNETNNDNNQYSGVTYTYNVLDTQGYIMYTYGKTLVVIEFVIRKHGFMVIKMEHTEIMLAGYRYAGTLSPSKNRHLIGFIEEQQERTKFRVVSMAKPLKQQWSIEKVNLLQFVSVGNDIAILSYNQVSIYSYLGSQPICNFRVHESWNSQICVLTNEVFLHMGEEVIAFGKKGIQNYGSIKLDSSNDNKQIIECKCINSGKSQYTLFCRQANNNSYIIAIGENGWTVLKQFKTINNIFTMTLDPIHNNLLTINQINQDIFQATQLNRKCKTIVQNIQLINNSITTMATIIGGEIVVMNCVDGVVIVRWNADLKMYEKWMVLENEYAFAVNSEYIVLKDGIHGMNYINCKSKLLVKDEVKDAICNEAYIGILNAKGQFKLFKCETQQIVSVRNECHNQYLWQLYQTMVVFVRWDHPHQLNIITNKTKTIQMDEIITDLLVHKFQCQKTVLLVGLQNGILKILQLNQNIILQTINLNKYYPIKLTQCLSKVLVSCGGWSLLSIYKNIHEYQLLLLDIPSSSVLTYCPNISRAMLFNDNSISIIQLPNNNSPSDTSSTQIEIVHKDIPFIIAHDGMAYLIIMYQLRIYDTPNQMLIKRQMHVLKDVRYAQPLQLGILILGIDDMQQGRIILFDWKELEIIFNLSFGCKKIPSCAKKYKQNQFLVRFDNSISHYQITERKEPKQLCTFFTNHSGYGLDVNQGKVVINDPLSYLIVYEMTNNTFLPISRHYRPYKIVDVCFISKSIIYADRAGYLGILEFNLEHYNDIEKLKMTQVASLHLSDQVFTFMKQGSDIYYGCRSGLVGRVRPIGQNQFKILKRAEYEAFNYQTTTETLKYQNWRQRSLTKTDKIVDEELIKYYLENTKDFQQKNPQLYEKVKNIYQHLINS